MEFSLEISRDNVNYQPVDLFPEQQLDYDLDFYDSLEIDKIKLPFYTTLRIPLTSTNKASNRFNFDPATGLTQDYPKEDFYFKITVYSATSSSSTEIGGILNVKSFEYNSAQSYIEVELKDYLSKYIAGLRDLQLGTLYGSETAYYRDRHTFTEFLDVTANDGEAGVIGQNPDYTRPISFPYIDFCNDVDGKFGYAARQFLEYGPGLLRTGIMPVFSVARFLEYIGLYLDSTNFRVRVDSKLFALGKYATSPAFKDFQAEKLHMVIPSQLQAKQDVNTRNFFVRQSPAWVGTNFSHESDEYQAGGDKMITTGYFGNMETAGNYGTDGEGNPLYGIQDWGAEKRMGFYPDDNDEGIRGFFCPKVSFNAGLSLQGGSGLLTIADAKLEIPIIYEDKLVDRIYSLSASSTMRFKIYIGIYEDGFMKKKIPLIDGVGDDIILTMSDVSNVVAGNSNKDTDFGGALAGYDYFDTRNLQGAIIGPGATFYDTLLFNTIEAYFPQDEELFVNMGSRYSINYFIEPLDGELDIRYVDSYTGSNPKIADVFAQSTFGVNSIKKAITRIDNYGPLNVIFTSNQDTFLYKDNDEFSIEDSINQTCPLKVSDILPAILKRFDCGLFYEFDDTVTPNRHVLRVDPISIARTGFQDVNQYVDDLKSVIMSNGGDKVKSLQINNKDYGLYFDDINNDGITIGSTTQEINNEGIAELKIDLDSSIYNRSVCGDDASDYFNTENLGAYSEKELGFTTNIFTPNKEVGLRFAYLDKPLYSTNLLLPYATLAGFRADDKMKTESEIIYSNSQVGLALPNIGGQHVFNGRLFPYNTAGWSLMFEDEDGNTTDTYDNIFAVSEKILQSENPRIEFDMVVPTSDLASLDFFLQTLTATRFTANPILVKSAKGEVFDDYAYLTIEGILQ